MCLLNYIILCSKKLDFYAKYSSDATHSVCQIIVVIVFDNRMVCAVE